MTDETAIEVDVRLLPPLNNTAGRDRIRLLLKDGATLQAVVDALLERFNDPEFRYHLYDTDGRFIPAWRAFINNRPAKRLCAREGAETPVADGDEVTFLLALAGG